MAKLRSRIGIGATAVGLALMSVGVFAGGASAQEGEVESEGLQPGDYGLTCDPAAAFTWSGPTGIADIDVTELLQTGEQTVVDGDFSVTLSNPQPVPGETLGELTIGALDLTTSHPVSEVATRIWTGTNADGESTYEFVTTALDPPTTSGHVGQLDRWAPIKGLAFCYEVEVAPTTTSAPTTTTEVEVAPTTVTAPTTTQIATEVLPQVVTAPQAQAQQPQLAFTGSDSISIAWIGGVLVMAGMLLVAIDRVGLVRRGRHSR
ncbi:MAG TPA: hypothetical protein VF183_09895 [Acidimicrobiales bacterium]